MTSAEMLPQSPSDKGKADMLEDLEKSSNKESAPTGEPGVQVTEEEVRIYSAADPDKAPDRTGF
jgi:hypothetical protein